MRYFFIDGSYTPKHCIYGPRPREAVFFSDWEWYKINDNLYRWNRTKQDAEMYSAKEQNKKELSFNMTKHWQNTLASIKTQSEQRRIEKKKKDKQDKIDEYNKIIESRKQERIPMLENAKRLLFESKDAARMITSAMIQCSVITEREKQIEFRKLLREEQEKTNAPYVRNMKNDAEEYRKQEQEVVIRKLEAKKKFRNDLLEQIEEKRKRTEEMKNKERRAEEEDLIKMKEVIKKLEECHEKEKQNCIKRTRMDYEKGYHAMELEKSKAIEEDEENEVNRMINKYAKRFGKERAQKEASMVEEAIKSREKITEALAKNLKRKADKEEEIYQKAVKEMEEENEKLAKKKEELQKKRESEMLKWEEEHKARVAAENLAREESLKWTILQNARKREIDKAWSVDRERRARETKARAREGYAKQIKEKEELAEKNRERDRAFLSKKDEEMDDVLKYCEDALDYTKKQEWKNYPLMATVAKLKNDYCALAETQNKSTKPEIQNKRPTESTGYVCYCFKN